MDTTEGEGAGEEARVRERDGDGGVPEPPAPAIAPAPTPTEKVTDADANMDTSEVAPGPDARDAIHTGPATGSADIVTPEYVPPTGPNSEWDMTTPLIRQLTLLYTHNGQRHEGGKEGTLVPEPSDVRLIHTHPIPLRRNLRLLREALPAPAGEREGESGASRADEEAPASPRLLRVTPKVLHALGAHVDRLYEGYADNASPVISTLVRGMTYGFVSPDKRIPPVRPVLATWPAGDELAYYNHLCAWTMHQFPRWTNRFVNHLCAMPTLHGEPVASARLAALAERARGHAREHSGVLSFDAEANPQWSAWMDELVRLLADYETRPPIRLHELSSHAAVQQLVPPFHSIHPEDKAQLLSTVEMMLHPVCTATGDRCARCNRSMTETPDDWETRYLGHFYASRQCKCATLHCCMRCTLEDWLYQILAVRAGPQAVGGPGDGLPFSVAEREPAPFATTGPVSNLNAPSTAHFACGTMQTLLAVRCRQCQQPWSPLVLQPVFHTYKKWFRTRPRTLAPEKVVSHWTASYKSSGRRGRVRTVPAVPCEHLHPVPEYTADRLVPVSKRRNGKPKTTKLAATATVRMESPFFRRMVRIGPLATTADVQKAQAQAAATRPPATAGKGEGEDGQDPVAHAEGDCAPSSSSTSSHSHSHSHSRSDSADTGASGGERVSEGDETNGDDMNADSEDHNSTNPAESPKPKGEMATPALIPLPIPVNVFDALAPVSTPAVQSNQQEVHEVQEAQEAYEAKPLATVNTRSGSIFTMHTSAHRPPATSTGRSRRFQF